MTFILHAIILCYGYIRIKNRGKIYNPQEQTLTNPGNMSCLSSSPSIIRVVLEKSMYVKTCTSIKNIPLRPM